MQLTFAVRQPVCPRDDGIFPGSKPDKAEASTAKGQRERVLLRRGQEGGFSPGAPHHLHFSIARK